MGPWVMLNFVMSKDIAVCFCSNIDILQHSAEEHISAMREMEGVDFYFSEALKNKQEA